MKRGKAPHMVMTPNSISIRSVLMAFTINEFSLKPFAVTFFFAVLFFVVPFFDCCADTPAVRYKAKKRIRSIFKNTAWSCKGTFAILQATCPVRASIALHSVFASANTLPDRKQPRPFTEVRPVVLKFSIIFREATQERASASQKNTATLV